jgi:hypothetical protein
MAMFRIGTTMEMGMRTAFFAAAATMLLTGAAMAHDYIVVSSSDPAIAKGVMLTGGAVVPLASGRSLTVMSPTGQLNTYRGGGAVVVLPKLATATDPGFFDALAGLVRRPPPRRITGAMRGGPTGAVRGVTGPVTVCAPAGELTTVEQIVAADAAGCAMTAKIALDAYVQNQAAATPQ